MEKEEERRQYKRSDVSCAIMLVASGSRWEVRGRTLNVSDGGAFFALTEGRPPKAGQRFQMKLALPRQTPNAYFLEHFVGPAEVVRMDEAEGREPRVAIRFDPAIPLDVA